jgi:cytochrome P450
LIGGFEIEAHDMESEFVDPIITDRRQERSTSMCGGSDLFEILLSAVDDHGQSWTDEEI